MVSLYGPRGEVRARVSPTETLGVPGTAIYAGYIEEREKDRSLISRDARYRTYANILSNTSIVASGIRYYANLIGGAEWAVSPAEDDTDAMYAEMAEAALMMDGDTPWNRVVRRASMYRFYGFSVQEWTMARREDGWFGYSDIAPRAQHTIERWIPDEKGRIIGIVQQSPQTQQYIPIPRDKTMYIVDDTLSDSPEGLGLFRHLVSPAKRLERYEQLEGFGFETDLRGIPILEVPLAELQVLVEQRKITKEQRDQMIKPLRDFAQNHIRTVKTGLLMDSSTYRSESVEGQPSAIKKWAVSLLQGNSQSFADNANAIERLNREMARILGVEQLLLGSGEGSFALSRDKTHQFYLMIKGALDDIRQAVEKDLLLRLWQLNGWPAEMMPTLAVEDVQYRSIAEVTAALREMAIAGVILDPTDEAVREVFELMGLSPPMSATISPTPDMGDDEGRVAA